MRITADLPFFFQAQEIGSQSDIPEIDFGRLDQAFGNVGMPRGQLKDDVARLENGKPLSGCGMGNSCFIAKILEIEELSGSSRTETDKFLKQTGLPYLDKLTNVPLHVCLEIVGHGQGWSDLHIMQSGIKSMQKETVDI
jgi:hypothetical protein